MSNEVGIAIRLKLLAEGVASGFKSVGDMVEGLGIRVKLLAATVVSYFGFQAFAGAVRGAAELEAKLSEVQAVSGATAEEMRALRKAAEDAGGSTKYTATEAAQALGNLTRAGLSAKDAIAALPATLSLAQAGGVELGQASEFVTKAVMGMGLAFSDARRVADVLAMGANASNTSVTGLAEALSYTAPIAHSLGLSLEETVAIIGKFADSGIDASRAGTALNAILSQFGDPASKFRLELGQAGIITNNFGEALRQLADKGDGGRKAILAVGTEAGPALRALLNQGMGALDDLTAKLKTAQGSAAATAAVMENNLNGALNSLSSAWDTVKNALATPVLPVLKEAATQLAKVLQDAVTSGTVGRFGDAIATAFKAAIAWVKGFAAELPQLAERLNAFADRAQEAFTRFGQYASNAGNVVSFTYNGIAAVVNLIIAGVAKVEEAFFGVAANIQAGVSVLLTVLSKITFGGISEGFKRAAEDVKISAGATWAASEALAAKAKKAFDDFDQAATNTGKAWNRLTEDQEANANVANSVANATKGATQALADQAAAAPKAGEAVKSAAEQQSAALEQARTKAGELRVAYEAAVAAGDWQGATEKMQAFQQAMQGVSKTAALTAQDVENAFERMGIKSSAALATAAAASERDFKIIRDAGTSTPHDIQEAFKKYAEDVIASGDQVKIAAVSQQAGMYGLEIATDAAGKALVRAKSALDSYNRSAEDNISLTAGEINGAKLITEQIDLLTAARERSISAREQEIAAQERQNAVTEREIELKNKARNVDANGFSLDMTGKQTVNAEGATALSVLNTLKGYGLTDAQAKDVLAEFSDNNGGIRFGGQYGASSLSEALRRAAEKRLLAVPFNDASTVKGSSNSSSTSSSSGPDTSVAPSTASTGGTTTPATNPPGKTVLLYQTVLQLPGRRPVTVQSASAADQGDLHALVRELAADAARAN